jgi:hypothetical protein
MPIDNYHWVEVEWLSEQEAKSESKTIQKENFEVQQNSFALINTPKVFWEFLKHSY